MGLFASKQEKLNKKLLSACNAGKLPEILQLLTAGADINAKNSEGDSALVYAICGRRTEAVQLLLAKGADVHAVNKSGKTLLMYACGEPKEDIIEQLLQTAIDLNAKNPEVGGWTALHYAAAYAPSDIVVSMLVKKGADINARDDDGGTPLHTAARRGRFPLIKALLAHGADANARDDQGNRPEELARRSNNNGIANFLQEKTAPAVVVKSGWQLTAPDEIIFMAEKTAAGYCLTEIFNFNSRIYTQIARNLKSGAESQAVRFFDEFPDKKVLEQAHQQLLQLGGKAAAAVIYSAILNKKSL